MTDSGDAHLQHLLACLAHLVLKMDIRGAHESVDARSLRIADRLAGSVDVVGSHAGQASDGRPPHLAGDLLHRGEITRRGDGEARLDHIHAQPGELMRHLELLLGIHARARALLAVPQRRIKDLDHAVHCIPLFAGSDPQMTQMTQRGRPGKVKDSLCLCRSPRTPSASSASSADRPSLHSPILANRRLTRCSSSVFWVV